MVHKSELSAPGTKTATYFFNNFGYFLESKSQAVAKNLGVQ